MKKRLVPIYSVLAAVIILLAFLTPSCVPTEKGTIEVKATLCGAAWEGLVNYTLTPASGWSINGTCAPRNFIAAVSSWTCGNVSGGPYGAYLVGIDPPSAQTVAANGTTTFTLNFELGQDASIEFTNWTINGVPVPVGSFEIYQVSPCDIIDAHFHQKVNGCAGHNATVNETSSLGLMYADGPTETVNITIANDWCALNKTPEPLDKFSQLFFVEDYETPIPPGTGGPITKGVGIAVHVKTSWLLEKQEEYTKTINWLGFSECEPDQCVLLDLTLLQPGSYLFWAIAWAEVALVGDVNPANNLTGYSDPIYLNVTVPEP